MDEIKQFHIELNNELLSILDFWIANTTDERNSGFVGRINHENQVVHGAEKGAVLNSRILWTFAAAFNHTGDKKYLEIADRAYVFIRDKFFDKEFGGLYWALDSLGNPINTRKQIYAQGFGIYGLSEYFKACGNRESLHLALELFECIEKYSYDPFHGG